MEIPIEDGAGVQVPKPASLVAKEQVEAAPVKPAGWWALGDISGSVEGVIREVEASAEVPDHWKQAIVADLRAKAAAGPGYNFVYLDVHYLVEKGVGLLRYSATLDKKLL